MIMMKLMINQYFDAGSKYEEIIALLKKCHGVEVSLRTLHRLLRMQIFTEKGIEFCFR